MSTPAFDSVLSDPASLAARFALLAEWRELRDPRAALLEKQLAYREISWSGRSSANARALKAEIDALIDAHGRAWAGRIAELVSKYRFHRGLVGEIELSGEAFLRNTRELFSLAPIQHVDLTQPLGSIEAITNCAYLARLASLHIDALGEAVGDAGAIALAGSAHVSKLAQLSLKHDAIGRAGVEALAASPHLARARYVGLTGNPVDPTPYVREENGTYSAGRPPLAEELEQRYGARPWLAVPTGHLPSWPGDRDPMATVPDRVSSAVLDDMERLALEVDRLAAAATDDESEGRASAKRQRLLIELDVSHFLEGTHAVRLQVERHPALLAYHDACVAMRRYLAWSERKRGDTTPIAQKLLDQPISLDWFRVPSGYTPSGVDPNDWLALCVRNFLDPMPGGTGSRYVRLQGQLHELLFRREVSPEPRLWRAQLA